MPHDRSGRELKAGDEVLFRAIVKEVYQSETACNAQYQIIDIDKIGEYTPVITCNTKLAAKVVHIDELAQEDPESTDLPGSA